jgi:hypothetical protein
MENKRLWDNRSLYIPRLWVLCPQLRLWRRASIWMIGVGTRVVKGLGRGACKWHGTAEATLQEAIVKAIYLRRRK